LDRLNTINGNCTVAVFIEILYQIGYRFAGYLPRFYHRRVADYELVSVVVRERIGQIASFKGAVVVKRLPKTRSGKILRGTIKKIADGVQYIVPATINDPGVLDKIRTSLAEREFPKQKNGHGNKKLGGHGCFIDTGRISCPWINKELNFSPRGPGGAMEHFLPITVDLKGQGIS
jgi:hypothetical protein